MAPQYSPYLRNCRLDWQSIIIRPWHELFASLTAWSYPKGIDSYLQSNASLDRLVVRHNQSTAFTPAFLTGGSLATTVIATWNAVTNGTFNITIDGVARSITWLNFSTDTTMAQIASRIQTAIRALTLSTETVVFSVNFFTISSANTTSTSAITVTSAQGSGTDISGAGGTAFLDAETGRGTVTAAVGNKLVTITETGTIAAINTGILILSDNRMFFQNVGDVVYCMNGSDNFGKLATTTYTTPSTWVSNFAPAFSVVFSWSHRASGWSTNPNKVYKSVADNYEDFASAWSDTFTFKETVTGLSAVDQSLFYFTKNTISVTGANDIQDTGWTLSFATRSLEAKEWAINNASIVEAWSNVYFVTPSNSINMIAKGQNVYGFEILPLSDRKYKGISKIMATLDVDQTASFGYFLPDKNLIKWFFKLDGSSFNDICIVYDVIKDCFYVDDHKYFYDGTFFKGKDYTVSMIEPKVYRDEYSQTDESTAIQREYRTKDLYMSDPTLRKILRESRTTLDINELASVTQTIYINGQQTDSKTIGYTQYIASWGNAGAGGIGIDDIGIPSIWEDWEDEEVTGDSDYVETYILRTKGNLNKKGNRFQFRRTNTSTAGKVRLKNLETLVEVCTWMASNRTV